MGAVGFRGMLWPRINNADATPKVTPASVR
jgi:hypothetical protein